MNDGGVAAGAVRPPCPWCGLAAAVVFVHGHGQCEACGANVEPCCDGAAAGDAAGVPTHLQTAVGPTLFAQVFVALGGATVTVTCASLEFALAQRLGCDLNEARLVLEAAEGVGVVERLGGPRPDKLYRLRGSPTSTA